MRVVAIDWSGARNARTKIWTAEAVDGRLVALANGRTREEVVEHLVALRDQGPLVVGLDFAFGFPAWWLDERGWRGGADVWAAAEREGERWLEAPQLPFWRAQAPEHDADRPPLRRTDRESGSASSVFKLVGPSQVGAGSVRGMPALGALTAAGFHVWPFAGPARVPLVVEIYPRLLTGPVVKSDPHERVAVLTADDRFGERRMLAAASDDAFDAAVSAVGMAERLDELLALPAAPDHEREGAIWQPGWPRATSAA
jgi:hypothetical protein